MGLRSLLNRLRRRGEPSFVVSIVALFDSSRVFDEARFRQAVQTGLGVSPVLAASGHGFVFEAYELELFVRSAPVPYVRRGDAVEQVADRFSDAGMRAAFAEHQSWLAVDVLRGDAAKGYHVAGRVLAELLDETTVALLAPADSTAVPFDPSTAYELRIGNAQRLLLASSYKHVTGVEATDVVMAEAIQEARRRWPEFVDAWAEHGKRVPFKVKARFAEGDEAEHMWVAVESMDGGAIVGKLLNDPFFLNRPRVGAQVSVSIDTITDRSIEAADGRRGNFTDRVLDRGR